MKGLLFLLLLAWRNIWRNKRRTFVSALSVFFAFFLAMAMESINRGQAESMIGNIVTMSSGYYQFQDSLYENEPSLDHTFLLPQKEVENIITDLSKELSLMPRIESYMLAASESKSRPVYLIGSDFEIEERFQEFEDKLVEGRIPDRGEDALLLTSGLARILDFELGDSIVLLGQGYQSVQAAGIYPIVGLVEFPLEQFNTTMVFMPLESAQYLLNADGRLSSLLVMAERQSIVNKEIDNLKNIANQKNLSLLSWEELNSELVNAMEFDRFSGRLLAIILYVIVGFGILGTVLTMTLERMREFGIILSVGMARIKLGLVCFMETLMICFLGLFFGLLFGTPLLLYLENNPIPLYGDMAQSMQDLGIEPVMLFSAAPGIFLQQFKIILIIVIFISLYPLWKVLTLDVVDASKR